MELPTIKKRPGSMLSGIKSKLGFADDSDRGRGYDGYDEYDGYDDYDEYDDYAEEDGYGDVSYADAGRTTRVSATSSRSRSSSLEVSPPRLVSIDDVRAHTQIPDSLNRDPLPSRHVTTVQRTSHYRAGRVLIDDTEPSPGSPESTARANRSAGLDSLFGGEGSSSAPGSTASSSSYRSSADEERSSASTTPQRAFGPAPGSPAARAAESAQVLQETASPSSFDPYAAYSGSGVAGHAPQRGVTVLRLTSYGDVERVAKVLRAGDVAILSLKTIPDDLAKRVLDFSFGVACYAEARVDCIGDKTFAIARGAALSESELASVRSQGVV